MFNFFNKKYNYWLQQEIDICEKYGYNLKKYINYNTHPLHAKQIKIALFDELPENIILKISNLKYTTEEDIIKERNKYYTLVDEKYFLEKYKPKSIKNTNTVDKQKALIGTILGDIIGSTYEFTDHEEIKDLCIKKSFFTDDTVLSVATKCAINENERNPDFAKWYRTFYNKYPRAGYGSGFVNWGLNPNKSAYGSYADGSAMRVSYIGAYYTDINDVISKAYKSAAVTHNHFEGIKGTIVTAVCIWMCKNEYTKDEIKEYLNEHYKYTEEQLEIKSYGYLYFNLEHPEKNKFKDEKGLSCPFAVPYAIYCFLNSNSLESCYKNVLKNFCDADTVCAIAGGLAGIYYDTLDDYKEFINEKLTEELISYIRT